MDRRRCSVPRAIDGSGALVDVVFGGRRGMAVARAFSRSAKAVAPSRVTTDVRVGDPRATRTEAGRGVRHRLGRNHRGLEGRYRPMRGFECPRSAARFCRAYDGLRDLLRPRSRYDRHVSADRRRPLLLRGTTTVLATLETA